MGRNLSKQEAALVLGFEWHGRRIVSRSDIIDAMNGNVKRADKAISSLRRKNWLERIGAGKYLLIPAERGPDGIADTNTFLLGSLMTSPYYFSYATANAFHGLTTQVGREVYVACCQKLRPRTVRGFMFRFIYLVEHKFFGYRETDAFGAKVAMADLEKAIIDSADKPDYAGGIAEVAGVIARGSRRGDWRKVAAYALQMNSTALVQRLGFLADCVGVQLPPGTRKRLKKAIKRNSRAYLGSIRTWGQRGDFDREWQLIVNVPREQVLAEV